jgi:hypothetical protein
MALVWGELMKCYPERKQGNKGGRTEASSSKGEQKNIHGTLTVP